MYSYSLELSLILIFYHRMLYRTVLKVILYRTDSYINLYNLLLLSLGWFDVAVLHCGTTIPNNTILFLLLRPLRNIVFVFYFLFFFVSFAISYPYSYSYSTSALSSSQHRVNIVFHLLSFFFFVSSGCSIVITYKYKNKIEQYIFVFLVQIQLQQQEEEEEEKEGWMIQIFWLIVV